MGTLGRCVLIGALAALVACGDTGAGDPRMGDECPEGLQCFTDEELEEFSVGLIEESFSDGQRWFRDSFCANLVVECEYGTVYCGEAD